MDIKGQYNILANWQKLILKRYAIAKNWTQYWYCKKMFLIKYYKTLNEPQS